MTETRSCNVKESHCVIDETNDCCNVTETRSCNVKEPHCLINETNGCCHVTEKHVIVI